VSRPFLKTASVPRPGSHASRSSVRSSAGFCSSGTKRPPPGAVAGWWSRSSPNAPRSRPSSSTSGRRRPVHRWRQRRGVLRRSSCPGQTCQTTPPVPVNAALATPAAGGSAVPSVRWNLAPTIGGSASASTFGTPSTPKVAAPGCQLSVSPDSMPQVRTAVSTRSVVREDQ